MLNHIKTKDKSEFGFTLIELLVVILIIGVLASIAIPAFLNQRQRANDAALKADVKNAVTIVEYHMGSQTSNARALQLSRNEINLSPGVYMALHGSGNSYCITAYHQNGKEFTSREQAFSYRNNDTGGGWGAACMNLPPQDAFLTAPTR